MGLASMCSPNACRFPQSGLQGGDHGCYFERCFYDVMLWGAIPIKTQHLLGFLLFMACVFLLGITVRHNTSANIHPCFWMSPLQVSLLPAGVFMFNIATARIIV